ncbi:saccharopine dehydrogenase (NAD+, L-lysine forming), partial [Tremellales sp. Uapishka_1]
MAANVTSKTTLWLRRETKLGERRTALTPADARTLIQAGVEVFVETCFQRIFEDSEYEDAGCKLSAETWVTHCPLDTPVLGLKELPSSELPLKHTHIYFGHCFKDQPGWTVLLDRFDRGGGRLYDLEFLLDHAGNRVAAFGYHAGFVGAALGLMATEAQEVSGKRLEPITQSEDEKVLVAKGRRALTALKGVKALVIGPNGRCGKGAIVYFRLAGLAE